MRAKKIKYIIYRLAAHQVDIQIGQIQIQVVVHIVAAKWIECENVHALRYHYYYTQEKVGIG